MRRYGIFGAITALGVVADQAGKIAVRHSMPLGVRRTIVSGFFDLANSQNTGAAFSLLHDVSFGSYILGAVGIAALVIIAIYIRRLPANATTGAVLLGLVASGAIGNLIDRIAFGRVTDFLLVHWHEHYWPVFNVADIALVVGVIGLILARIKWEPPAGDRGRPSAGG